MSNDELEILFKLNPEVLINTDLKWVVHNKPHWMLQYNPDILFKHRPRWVYDHFSSWVINNRPDWMASNYPNVLIAIKSDWVKRYRPDLLKRFGYTT